LSDLTKPLASFPFERDQTYTFGELRAFERRLSIARQADQSLSKEWRVPSMPTTRRWEKIREETYALMLLADVKGFTDDSTFRLTPSGFPNVDAEIANALESFQVQVTIADPIWLRTDGSLSNGGYDHRLTMEALNTDGVAHGLAAMRRSGGNVISDRAAKSSAEAFEACLRGLECALRRKIRRASSDIRLLVQTRAYYVNLIDFSFEKVVQAAFRAVGQNAIDAGFSAYYVLDDTGELFLEYFPRVGAASGGAPMPFDVPVSNEPR
jgi:hypothetical protein